MVANPGDDIVIKLRVDILQAQSALKKAKAQMNEFGTKGAQSLRQVASAQQELHKRTTALNRELNKSRGEFPAWALSIMFFGMALQRTFDTIWRSSTKTFNDVMHSVEGTVTGFDILEGSLKYLGFTAGQALEPLALMLVPIIDKISQWVVENEGVFRTFMLIIGVLGPVLVGLGMAVTTINGLSVAFASFKPTTPKALAVLIASRAPARSSAAVQSGSFAKAAYFAPSSNKPLGSPLCESRT
jgi:hypothetical protein